MRSRFVDYPRNPVNSRYSSTFLSTFIKNTFGRYRKCDVISRKFFYYRRWDDVGVWVIIANIVARHEETPILNFVTNIILRNASFTGGFCEFLVLSISQSTMYVLTLSFHTHDICSLQNWGMQLCKFHRNLQFRLSSNGPKYICLPTILKIFGIFESILLVSFVEIFILSATFYLYQADELVLKGDRFFFLMYFVKVQHFIYSLYILITCNIN